MPRKRLVDPVTKLKVVFEPDEGGWHVYVPSLQGCRTWGRSLSEARRNIREAISLYEEDLGGHEKAAAYARDVAFEEEHVLPAPARKALERYETARAGAQAATVALSEAQGAVARALTENAQVSLRDAGELLGLSAERVRRVLVRQPQLARAKTAANRRRFGHAARLSR